MGTIWGPVESSVEVMPQIRQVLKHQDYIYPNLGESCRSHGPPWTFRLSWIRWEVKTAAHGMGAGPGSIHSIKLEKYQVNLYIHASMEKGGTGGIYLTNIHWDFSMFLALEMELRARKRHYLHRVYSPARETRYRSASVQPCCNIHQWRKCCWPSTGFLLKMWSTDSSRSITWELIRETESQASP